MDVSNVVVLNIGSKSVLKNKEQTIPITQGRVYAIIEWDTQAFQDAIQGMLTISSTLAKVLIDPGFTHFFASHKFAHHLNIELSPLDYVLVVSTPTNKDLTTSTVYQAYIIEIANRELPVDLKLLDMHDFDVILSKWIGWQRTMPI